MSEVMPYLDVHGNHDAFVMIQTVYEKFGMFTEKQVENSIESRDIQARMSHPNNEKFKLLVSSKLLDNCSAVASDVTNAWTMFFPNRSDLRRKKVRQRPERVIPEYLYIPRDFIDCNVLLL